MNMWAHSEKRPCVSSSFLHVGNSSLEFRELPMQVTAMVALGLESKVPKAGSPRDPRIVFSFQLSYLLIPLLSPDLRDLGLNLAEGEDINPHVRG